MIKRADFIKGLQISQESEREYYADFKHSENHYWTISIFLFGLILGILVSILGNFIHNVIYTYFYKYYFMIMITLSISFVLMLILIIKLFFKSKKEMNYKHKLFSNSLNALEKQLFDYYFKTQKK